MRKRARTDKIKTKWIDDYRKCSETECFDCK